MAERICSIEGCGGKYKARGWCHAHYRMWRSYGDPLASRQRNRGLVCVVEGCGRIHSGHGFCKRHLHKYHRYGDPEGGFYTSEAGDDVGYPAVHMRLRRARGRASDHLCVDCGRPADQWSYQGGAPDERWGVSGGDPVPYTTDLDYYVPRCFVDHRRFDLVRR